MDANSLALKLYTINSILRSAEVVMGKIPDAKAAEDLENLIILTQSLVTEAINEVEGGMTA